MTAASGAARMTAAPATVETRRSWLVALCALDVLSVAFGAPTITDVAMAPIAAHFGGERTVPAVCYALVWLCAGAGGQAMRPVAAGGWLGGAIYYVGFCRAAFATGIGFNLANLLIVGALVHRRQWFGTTDSGAS
jgi:hypothetical protein